jgi:hypothetical protein
LFRSDKKVDVFVRFRALQCNLEKFFSSSTLRSFTHSQLIENIKILVSSDCVKDGSGALYDFAGQGAKP